MGRRIVGGFPRACTAPALLAAACLAAWLGGACQPGEAHSGADVGRPAETDEVAVGAPAAAATAESTTGRLPGVPVELSPESFELIKRFVLQQGDRQTYCNMYNNNPHYRFDGFDVYLNPDAGQRNINCDPALSGFDELVIRDERISGEYVSVKVDPNRRALITSGGAVPTAVAYFAEMLRTIQAEAAAKPAP